jgi:hypothetical protein
MYTPIIDIMKTTSKYQHSYDKFLLSSDKISDFVLHIEGNTPPIHGNPAEYI